MLRGVKVWTHLVVVASIAAVSLLAAWGIIGEPNRPEKISHLQVVGSPAGESGLRVTETIDQDFGTESRHGPELVVPNDFGIPTEITASSPDAPDDLHVEQVYSPIEGTRIRVGDPDVTVTGEHRYVISYVLPAARFASPTFAWDAVGAESEIPIEDVTVFLPGITLDEPRCTVGAAGSDDPCTFERGAPLRLAWERLEPKEGITVSGEVTGWTEAAVTPSPPIPERREDRRQATALAVALLGTLAAGTVGWRSLREGRNEVVGTGAAEAAHGVAVGPGSTSLVSDAELVGMATVEFAPPRGIEPWQGAVAVTERLDQGSVTAWFSGAIAADLLSIEKKGSHPRLSRGPRFHEADPVSTRVIEKLLANREVVDLNGYDPAFAKAWSEVEEQQDRWVANAGWWRSGAPKHGIPRPGGCATLGVLVIALIPAFFVGVILDLLGVIGGLLSALVIGAGVPALTARVGYARLRPSRTANGSAYALQTESFRRFLVESEGQYVEWAWRNGLLRQYSAWAVALDAAEAWQEAMERAGVPREEIEATATPLMVHQMQRSFASSRVDPTTTTSSGSSGSSSGGFSGSVGGGGGGGSHGSW